MLEPQMISPNLIDKFQTYALWRQSLSLAIKRYGSWLIELELNDANMDQRLARLLDHLSQDKLVVAFVAEFSRGKSELINAIFFADYGQRLLPASVGRTTMCPTELLFDQTKPPSIQLLPIETRATHTTTAEFKNRPKDWKIIPLDILSADSMLAAFKQVGQTKRVPIEEAQSYGLYDPNDMVSMLTVHEDKTVDVPCWRHAIINFPHPLLKQGLVILDTPGLNAIGTEPELTLNLLPNAHAILFILAADTGVTKSDIEVWRNHIGNTQGRQKGRLVVLNKIDGLWDGIKNDQEIEGEIKKQITSCADLLGLHPSRIFPITAQKGLAAKVNKDSTLLEKSRLLSLERALSDDLIPSKQEIIRDRIQNDITDLIRSTTATLEARRAGITEQFKELKELRGKNRDMIQQMMWKISTEKQDFEKSLQRFQATRSVFSTLTNNLFSYLGMDALKQTTKRARNAMIKASLPAGMRQAVADFFNNIKLNCAKSTAQINEITSMMEAMYRKFNTEHGLVLGQPISFSMSKYKEELQRLESSYDHRLNLMVMVTTGKTPIVQKFFETTVSQVRSAFESANQEVESWLKAVMSPMEAQVREHQLQLRHRLENLKRIHAATDTLEDRIAELAQAKLVVDEQLKSLAKISSEIEHLLNLDPPSSMRGSS